MIQQGTAVTNKSGIAQVVYPVSLPSHDMFIASRSRVFITAYTTDIAWSYCIKTGDTPAVDFYIVVEPQGYEISVNWVCINMAYGKN